MGTAPRAQAGTLESNDILIRISPLQTAGENKIDLESIVIQQFGKEILKTIQQSLLDHSLSSVHIEANDHGALECTIKARMETAIARYKESAA